MATRRRTAGSKRILTLAQAEKRTKAAARKRRVTLELTPEQMAAFGRQYRKLNPTEAAELVFTVKKRPTSLIKVAGYSYHGDTCCV
jgi:hypothetical protein